MGMAMSFEILGDPCADPIHSIERNTEEGPLFIASVNELQPSKQPIFGCVGNGILIEYQKM